MADARAPKVYSIPVYRAFGDALVAGILAEHGRDRMTLARGTIVVPNQRAGRSLTDAFVRRAETGLLLPRIVAVGDAGEAPALAFDGIDDAVPPAIDPLVRTMMLARAIQRERALVRAPVGGAEALRLAAELGGALDELIAEDVSVAQLQELDVREDLAVHWQASLALFGTVLDGWPDELAALGRIDLPDRRNRLLRALAARWRATPPTSFVIAAGVTSSALAIAELLAVIARLPRGAVVLPGVDLASPDAEWDTVAGGEHGRALETHPQHHLRFLLDRIGVTRAEVVRWRWGDGKPRKAVRGRAVSNAFAPARFTAKWLALKSEQRRLPGVRLATFASPADEAQGIAIALREALETPERTAALVTPDRVLAARVAAHLLRWGIVADDSAGQPLAAHPVGVLVQALAQLGVERFAPAALLAVLKHPLVRSGDDRLTWLEGVRTFDLGLRGPRPAPGLAGLTSWLAGGTEREQRLRGPGLAWWRDQAALFTPLEAAFAQPLRGSGLGDMFTVLVDTLSALCGPAIWSGPAGRAAADLFGALADAHRHGLTDVVAEDIPAILRQLLGGVTIRPPQGGHPRIAIWGLIEARLQQADVLVLGGMNEGSWPQATAQDPWLSPRVRRELGLADPERRIGLAAHDLATALGAHAVLLTRSVRDARSPTNPSRFLLRIEAMTDGLEVDARLPALATAIDAHLGASLPATRPAPSPPAAMRPRRISVTEVDRLKADPYAFYARSVLRLRPLDAVDAAPGPAWRGSAVHDILDRWLAEDKLEPALLMPRVDAMLTASGTHSIVRMLWRPRLVEAIAWIAQRIAEDREDGREPIGSEIKGAITLAGIELSGIADRIDRLRDGRLAVIDYKTGKAPSNKAVAAGYSMQLGLLAAIAQHGGFAPVAGTVGRFEYWSLAKDGDRFGKVTRPVGGKGQSAEEDFVGRAEATFTAAAERWLTGDAPFTAKLVPEYAPYEDYDQLMRRDEWYARED